MGVREIEVAHLVDEATYAGAGARAERAAERIRDVLDGADRGETVNLLAVLASRIEDSPPRPAAHAAFLALRPTLLRLVEDPRPGVRTMTAWLLGGLGPGDDPAETARTVAALRSRLADDADPSARASRLRALAALAPGDLSDDPDHEELRHPVALVRLAAAERVHRHRAASQSQLPWPAGFGHVVGRALAEVVEQPWPRRPWGAARWDETQAWVRRLVDQPVELASMAATLTPPPPKPVSTGAVLAARTWLATRRDAPARLWGTVVEGLWAGGATTDAAARALHDAGSAAVSYADRLVEWLRDGPSPDATGVRGAVAALIGIGDRRALRWVPDRWFSHWPVPITVPVEWAPEMLPGAIAQLRKARADDPEVSSLLRALAAWGPVAAPALPELLPLLSGPWAWEVTTALGRIGPPARAAGPALRAYALGDGRPARRAGGAPEPGMPWAGAPTAAWAHWRITGDPEPALSVIGAAMRRGTGSPFHLLAELGPMAHAHAEAVRDVLRQSQTAPASVGPRARTHAAEAWWRLTGDPAEAVPALLPALCPDGLRDPWVAERSVELLGEIGAPAAPALPALDALLASPWRHGGGVRSDEAIRAVASAAVTRIRGSG
ncbi:HEAT repeat domain-containing protein [Streptomyces sp. NPDC048604]|uniref:HEAT repeat domain-containing protein n=1 Tax=Streptomyces sp. NPDC048604 TaxID=3365578 RepID=UPI00371BEF5C